MRHRAAVTSTDRALRLFFLFAIISLVPVLVLGLVLAASYRSNAADRGLSQARAQAGLFGRTSIEPRLGDADLTRPLDGREVASLDRMSSSAVAAGDIVRFRIRSLDGRVIYSNDGSQADETDDEALEAADGETVAAITHLNADNDRDGAVEKGIRVAEVYTPITDGRSAAPVGVLEVYLPYDPIAQDIDTGLRSLYRGLAIGLGLLYLVLAGISWSVTRRLRVQAARNAHLASFDQLTELPNRRVFQGRLNQALAHADRRGLETAIAIVNVDRFREVNDTLGHDNGDALLVEVSRRLRAALGADDFICRLGGDEFAVLLSSANPPDVHERITTLRGALDASIDLAGIPVEVEATVGLARSATAGVTAEALLRHADVAVHLAKQSGMRLAQYDAEKDPYDASRLALVSDMRGAIDRDELMLYYQPKIDVGTGVVESVEALIRWNHPERGLLMPDEFLPVIEQTAMIDPMTTWVLDTALTWIAGVGGPTTGLRVAVNVSARNLAHADFHLQVADALRRHGCRADQLCVEVTETALMADPPRAQASLRRLAATGVRISVDDFGCGQTSLSQLAALPLNEVKIDKGFVTQMRDNPAHAAIVESITSLAHRLDFEVVAEGVEDQLVLDALRGVDCDIAQGYHVARPMPAPALDQWLRAHDATRFVASPV